MKIIKLALKKIKKIYPFKLLCDYIKYKNNPRYAIYVGTRIENRALMILCARPKKIPYIVKEEIRIHGYFDYSSIFMYKSFYNHKGSTYYADRKYCNINTFQELIKWRRLIDTDDYTIVLKKTKKGWCKLDE